MRYELKSLFFSRHRSFKYLRISLICKLLEIAFFTSKFSFIFFQFPLILHEIIFLFPLQLSWSWQIDWGKIWKCNSAWLWVLRTGKIANHFRGKQIVSNSVTARNYWKSVKIWMSISFNIMSNDGGEIFWLMIQKYSDENYSNLVLIAFANG